MSINISSIGANMISTITTKIKQNPLMILLGSAGSIIAVVSALFTVDARYAHAADVEQDKVQTQRLVQDTTRELRKQMLEDKLFELDIKKSQAQPPKLTPVDQAMKDRYQRQLNELVMQQSVTGSKK